MFHDAWVTPPPRLPFKDSIAFLVGVSDYRQLKSLPGINTDLEHMRDYLLNEGGFDRVYVARGPAATPSVVQHYMMDVFHEKTKIGEDDRLLFYCSGHGADAGGNNPYLQFADAVPGSFGDDQVMPVDSYQKWSSRVLAKHALFIFDACVAGEVLKPQGDGQADEHARGLLESLSGKGSRTLVTAGTFAQETWYADVKGAGHSVFTDALLTVLRDPRVSALMTIDEVVGKTQILAADFAVKRGVAPALPQAREFDADKPGRFVFFNAAARSPKLPENVALQMGLRAKGERNNEVAPGSAAGTIAVVSGSFGYLWVDNQAKRFITPGETLQFLSSTVSLKTKA